MFECGMWLFHMNLVHYLSYALNILIQRSCFKILSWHCLCGLKSGSVALGEQRLTELSRQIDTMTHDCDDIGSSIPYLDIIFDKLIKDDMKIWSFWSTDIPKPTQRFSFFFFLMSQISLMRTFHLDFSGFFSIKLIKRTLA